MLLKDRLDIVIKVLTILGMVGFGCIAIYLLLIGNGPSTFDLGPLEWQISTSFPQTPFVVPNDVPTNTSQPSGPSLESLGIIQIFGNSNQGTQIQIPKTGVYRFAYLSGSYATYPINSEPPDTKTWLTAVLVFDGNRAIWDGRTIRSTDALLKLFDTKYWESSDEAENSARGQYLEYQFGEGSILTLIAVDHLDSYNDNPGQVFVELYFVQY